MSDRLVSGGPEIPRSQDSTSSTAATRRLPLVGFLRSQIETVRALSSEQPGVIRLSCFDAEDVLAAIEAADEYLRRENYATGEDVDEALERLEECVSLLFEPRVSDA